MTRTSRLAFAAAIAMSWWAMLAVAHADNCGSPEDCQAAPGNIDAATAAAAALAAAALVEAERQRQRRAAAQAPDEDFGPDMYPPQPAREAPTSSTFKVATLDQLLGKEPTATPSSDAGTWPDAPRDAAAPSDAAVPSDGSAPADLPASDSRTDAAGQEPPRRPLRGGVPDGPLGNLSDLSPDVRDEPGRKPGS